MATRHIASVRSDVTVAEYTDSGAVLVHLLCPGERENFFAACFRTCPENDRGLPHIIEHTVLNGSKKYPVKDPFMEMVKSSMATFINALTYGDRTVYPCGSLNISDFRNLISVYMDAVFNPLLRRESFLQEGYRLDWDGETGMPVHNGVVYNEMKGAYSDPDSYMEREITRTLYPCGTAGMDSGGDPPAITGLTYREFLDFHRRNYSPDNCCFFALTQIPFQEFADFIHGMIPLRSGDPAPFVPQPPFTSPVRRDVPIPGDEGSCTAVSAWKVNSAGSPVDSLAFAILEDILLESDTSPVRAALLNSGLGTGLSVCGYDSDPLERNFIIGLKGVSENRAEEVLRLIRSTLEELCEKGISRELAMGMLHRRELHLKTAGAGWPVALMNAVTAAWTHGEDIMEALDLEAQFATLKERFSSPQDYPAEMVRKWLLNNPHRVDLVFRPSPGHFSDAERKSREELEKISSAMSPEEKETLMESSLETRQKAMQPDSPEDLSSLPKLHLKDIPRDTETPFHTELPTPGGVLLKTSMETSGVCYVDLVLDLTGLPEGLIPHASLYADLITRTGSGELDHLEMDRRELACSGGLNASVKTITSTVRTSNAFRLVLRISGYCLKEDLPGMLDLMRRRIMDPDAGNRERILSVTGEMAEHEKSTLIPAGHTVALLQARSGLSEGHRVANQLAGVPFLHLLSSVGKDTVQEHADALEGIKRFITGGVQGVLAWTGPDHCENTVIQWMNSLPLVPGKAECNLKTEHGTASATGIEIAPGTCFAAAALPGLSLRNPLAAPGTIFLRMMSQGFLWDRIRVEQGAYGAGASLAGGSVSFYSYRDPAPSASLNTFREVLASGMERLDLSERTIEDSIIAALKTTDVPVRPAMANGMAVMRHLREVNGDAFMEYRKRLLAVNGKSLEEFFQWLKASGNQLRSCIMGDSGCLQGIPPENRVKA